LTEGVRAVGEPGVALRRGAAGERAAGTERRHWKLAPASDENEKLVAELLLGLVGEAVIAAVGAVVSTAQLKRSSACRDRRRRCSCLPAGSVALT